MDGTKTKTLAALRRVAPRDATARPDPTAWPQSELLSYKLAILSRLLERGSEAALARRYGLWLTDCRLLGHLLAKSPRTVRDLAEDMVMDKAPISRSASRLLQCLLDHAGEVVAKEVLLQEVWGHTGVSDVKAILDEFKAQGFVGPISVEYEHKQNDNLADVKLCIDYVRDYGTKK